MIHLPRSTHLLEVPEAAYHDTLLLITVHFSSPRHPSHHHGMYSQYPANWAGQSGTLIDTNSLIRLGMKTHQFSLRHTFDSFCQTERCQPVVWIWKVALETDKRSWSDHSKCTPNIQQWMRYVRVIVLQSRTWECSSITSRDRDGSLYSRAEQKMGSEVEKCTKIVWYCTILSIGHW